MRIVGLILFMLLFGNTLNEAKDDKEVQIKEEKYIDTNVQRKLQEKTNYVTLTLSQDFSFTIQNKSIIEKVIINNGEPENLDKEIKVKRGKEIQIYFNEPLRNGEPFFRYINSNITKITASVDFSKFDSSNLEDMCRRNFISGKILYPDGYKIFPTQN